ncbi:MAG: DUF6655 family protein [Planctomycetota bacterium]
MRHSASAASRVVVALAAGVPLFGAVGCATTSSSDTARTGMEQLLVSDAIDHSISKIDLRPLAGKSVFVDDQYLDCVDKGYVVSSLRHRVMNSGARLAKSADDADLVAEIRSGGVGTDRQESWVGTPQVSLPGILPVELPEIKVWNRDRQLATAKIGVVIYDAKTLAQIGTGGMSLARSDDSNTFLMGAGPWQSGSVKESIRTGERSGQEINPLPYQVAVGRPSPFSSNLRYAGGEGETSGVVTAEGASE